MESSNHVCLSDKNERDDNQDSYLIVEFTPYRALAPLLLLSVADGMGGYEHGAQVSRESLRHLCMSLFRQLAVEPALNSNSSGVALGPVHLAAALREAAVFVDNHVRRLIEANDWSNAGATIVIAAICEGEVVGLNLGDSPLFHYELANQTLRQLSEDHTAAQTLVRNGVITPEMGRYHEANSQLKFYVGCGEFPESSPVCYCKLEPGDLLLLCTDGVSRLIGMNRMSELLRKMERVIESPHGLANIAEAILEVARDAGELDNQTLIIWRYVSSGNAGGSLTAKSPSD